jgi:hypothetical protein
MSRSALKLQRKAGLRRLEAVEASTKSPWTRDFKHLLPLPRYWINPQQPRSVKAVPATDRIKYWNIVPGDQIRIRRDRDGAIHEVQAVNRLRNKVFLRSKVQVQKMQNLKQHTFLTIFSCQREIPPGKDIPKTRARNVSYANCQLFIGNFDFPSSDGSGKPRVSP